MTLTVPEKYHAKVGLEGLDVGASGDHAIPLMAELVPAQVAMVLQSQKRR